MPDRVRANRFLFVPFLILLNAMGVQAAPGIATPFPCQSSHTPRPLAGPVPPIPSLPEQYSMKVEANIQQKRWTTEVEEHYDSFNRRASLSQTFNGSTTVSIFNFRAKKRYDIYPNGTCMTGPVEGDLFGLLDFDGRNVSTKSMTTINSVFRFGTSASQTYIGKDVVRGIPVNHWSSCQKWSYSNATFQLDYYFSDPDYTTAAGKEQIPVRVVLNGTASNVGFLSQRLGGIHKFEHVYEFTSMRIGPMLNEEVFQIPAGVICKDIADGKPVPKLPDRFEMSMEVIVPDTRMHPRQQYLRYDFQDRLVETWNTMVVPQDFDIMTAHTQGPKRRPDEGNLITVSLSTVEDFKNGVVYAIDKKNLTCSAQKMSASMSSLGMSHGGSLMKLAGGQSTGESGFMYQGQTTFRNMLVDAWATEENGITQEVYYLAEQDDSIKSSPSSSLPDDPIQTNENGESSSARKAPSNHNPNPTLVGIFLKNRTVVDNSRLSVLFRDIFTEEMMKWASVATTMNMTNMPPSSPPELDMSTGDQLAWGLEMERRLDRHVAEKIVHVFHYNPLLTTSINFQVSLCYSDSEISQVMLVVGTSYAKDVLTYFAAFSNSLRHALATAIDVSVLQISNLVPMPLTYKPANIDATTVTFTLLGKPPVEGTQQKPLGEAKRALEHAIVNGITFNVPYLGKTKTFMVDKNMFALDYDKFELPKAGKMTPAADADGGMPPGAMAPSTSKDNTKADTSEQKSGSDDSDKYSPAAVAGIAFATLLLGAVLCMGAIFAFMVYRRRQPGESIIPYRLTK